MKLLLLAILLQLSGTLLSQSLLPEQPMMCSDLAAETEARCTGSANCRACKNCKYCGHCNSGGSCGVCSSGGTRTYRSSTYTTTPSPVVKSSYNPISSRGIYNLPDDPVSQYYMETLIVTNEYLNMRLGPSTNYQIIQRLKEGQLLEFLAMTGSWVKVRININGTSKVGFVHMNYVAVLTD